MFKSRWLLGNDRCHVTLKAHVKISLCELIYLTLPWWGRKADWNQTSLPCQSQQRWGKFLQRGCCWDDIHRYLLKTLQNFISTQSSMPQSQPLIGNSPQAVVSWPSHPVTTQSCLQFILSFPRLLFLSTYKHCTFSSSASKKPLGKKKVKEA